MTSSFNLKHQKESYSENPMMSRLFGNFWNVKYDPSHRVFFLVDQGGFIPSHQETLGIIEELCNYYDTIPSDAIEKHNGELYESHNLHQPVKTKEPLPLKAKIALKGFVYLIKYGSSNLYKIGLSKNPKERLKQLQSAIPENLFLLHTIEASNMMELEAYFHQMFSHCRARSEWFELTDDEVLIFKNYTENNHG
jgi:hypothetical protein